MCRQELTIGHRNLIGRFTNQMITIKELVLTCAGGIKAFLDVYSAATLEDVRNQIFEELDDDLILPTSRLMNTMGVCRKNRKRKRRACNPNVCNPNVHEVGGSLYWGSLDSSSLEAPENSQERNC